VSLKIRRQSLEYIYVLCERSICLLLNTLYIHSLVKKYGKKTFCVSADGGGGGTYGIHHKHVDS
jgi:hypothetical protein